VSPGLDQQLGFLVILVATDRVPASKLALLMSALIRGGSYCFACVVNMLLLDSSLMDLSEEDIDSAGYQKELVGITGYFLQ
jgi:hypothetical protein